MKKMVIQLICPDQRGIIAKLTSMLYDSTINILSIEQHVDKEKKKFYHQHFSWGRVYLAVFPVCLLLGVGLLLTNIPGNASKTLRMILSI